MFSSSDNGPGWALVMYYRITEDTCQQLKDLSTASPAVKLWAEWCEKAQHDAAMRARFKVCGVIFRFLAPVFLSGSGLTNGVVSCCR